MFDVLGFTEEPFEDTFALRPPPTDVVTQVGRLNRRKLLRAWVEVSAWVVDFRRVHGTVFILFTLVITDT